MFGLHKKIVVLKTNRLIKKEAKSRQAVNYFKARKVGLVFTIEDMEKHEQIKKFVKMLELDHKEVSVLAYLGKGKHNHEFKFDFFTSKDFTFWGDFNSNYLEKFAAQPFDYLFNLDLASNVYIENLLARSNAKCRIGGYNGHSDRFFEMMVKIDQAGGFNTLVDQIYHYTKALGQVEE